MCKTCEKLGQNLRKLLGRSFFNFVEKNKTHATSWKTSYLLTIFTQFTTQTFLPSQHLQNREFYTLYTPATVTTKLNKGVI